MIYIIKGKICMKKVLLIILILLSYSAFASDKTPDNLTEYFQYIPNEIHSHWTPYKSNSDYDVTVQFVINKNGEISNLTIVNSTNERANTSVINAVHNSAPFKPLPLTFKKDSVKAQIELQYKK